MRNTSKLLVVCLGLLATGAAAQETATPDTESRMHGMAPGQSMMDQGGMPGMMGMMGMMQMMQMMQKMGPMMEQMAPMMEQCSEMMAAMTSRMPPAPAEPGSPDDNG